MKFVGKDSPVSATGRNRRTSLHHLKTGPRMLLSSGHREKNLIKAVPFRCGKISFRTRISNSGRQNARGPDF